MKLSEVKRICRECGAYVLYADDAQDGGHKCREAPEIKDWETEGELIAMLEVERG